MKGNNNYVEPRLTGYLHARAQRAGIPLAGNFELTPCCNLSCRMCYVRKSPKEAEALGGILPAQWWLERGREAAEAGMLFLLLTGGEPLLHPGFKELYRGLKKLGLMVSINTNGTLVDGDMVDFLSADPPTRVNLTLYGSSPETYARLCGDGSAFDRALWAIRALKGAGISVKLNLSLTPYNCADAERIFQIAGDCGTWVQPACYMFPPTRRDPGSLGGGDRFAPEEAARYQVLCDRLRLGDEGFMKRAENMREGLALQDGECQELPKEHMGCRAGKTAFWLAWNGLMSPCGMMDAPAVSLRERGFKEAWEEVRRAAGEIMMPPKCTACPVRHACAVCAAACLTETGGHGEAPEYLCRMTRALVERTEEEYQHMKKEGEHADQA